MIDKKYEFTDSILELHKGTVLHQIRALRDFNGVKKGDLGGFIESENNLSHEGNCWVFDKAKVFDDAKIRDNAIVTDNASVFGHAEVTDDSSVMHWGKVFDNACIRMHARVRDHAHVYGSAKIFNNAIIRGNAAMYNSASAYDHVEITDEVIVCGRASIKGYAFCTDSCIIEGNAEVKDYARVAGHAHVYGNAIVPLYAKIGLNADISKPSDIIQTGPIGSRNDYVTGYKTKLITGETCICIKTGCFENFLSKFRIAVDKKHGNNQYGLEYKKFIEMVEAHFNSNDEENDFVYHEIPCKLEENK